MNAIVTPAPAPKKTFVTRMVGTNTYAVEYKGWRVIIRIAPGKDSRTTNTYLGEIVSPVDGRCHPIASVEGDSLSLFFRPSEIAEAVQRRNRVDLDGCIKQSCNYIDMLCEATVWLDAQIEEHDSTQTRKKQTKAQRTISDALAAKAVELRHGVGVTGNGRWSYSETAVLVKGHAALVMTRNYRTNAIELRTYKVGDEAVHGSYNLKYTGSVTKITATHVWVDKSDIGGRTKRMTAESFASYNRDSIESVHKHNAETSRHI